MGAGDPMRAHPTFMLAIAAFLVTLGAAAAPAAKTKAPASKADETPYKDEEHTEVGHKFNKEPHEAKHHTVHGAWVKKAPIKHVPIPHSHFRKLPVQDGLIALPNGQKVAPADFHAG